MKNAHSNSSFASGSGSDSPNTKLAAVILAGGEGRRMQGQLKPLSQLGDRPLLSHVIDRIAAQTGQIMISSNEPLPSELTKHLPCIADPWQDRRGPLAGLYSAMNYLHQANTDTNWLLSSPVDSPFIPLNMAVKLLEAAISQDKKIAFAHYKGRDHYLCSLWSCSLMDKLKHAVDHNKLAVRKLIAELGACSVDFSDESQQPEPFFNINSPDELREAEDYFNNPTKEL